MVDSNNDTSLPHKRATVRDIAKLAGVHFTTVAKALKNHSSLSKATKQKILKIARKLDYKPDPAVTALNAYRMKIRPRAYQSTLAWINNWSERMGWENTPTRNLIACMKRKYDSPDPPIAWVGPYFGGARDMAEGLGYKLEEFWIGDPNFKGKSIGSILSARGIRGLLLAPQEVFGTEVDIPWKNFSSVMLDYSLKSNPMHLVTPHYYSNMNMVLEHLLKLGYRRPGYCTGYSIESNHWASRVYSAAFLRSQGDMFPENPIPVLVQNAWNAREVRQWLRDFSPDCIICDYYHFPRWLEENFHLKAPRDIGIVSLWLPTPDEKISGIYQNYDVIGKYAMELLVSMLHRQETGIPSVHQNILIDGIFCEGKTLRKK